jgi:acetamidase/formamidase
MTRVAGLVFCALLVCAPGVPAAGKSTDITGRWEVTTTFLGGSFVSGIELERTASGYTGRGGYLVPGPVLAFRYEGATQKEGVRLAIRAPDGAPLGQLLVTEKAGVLSGQGVLNEVPITVTARRPLVRPDNAPRLHVFEPTTYYGAASYANPPALRIFPGDTVRTRTLDDDGYDEHNVRRTLLVNPHNGPFYIEGAMPGDTIAVHFDRIRLNRDTATQYRAALNPGALPTTYPQAAPREWSMLWKLDREQGIARPEQPSEKLGNLTLKLAPMMGGVAVAPPNYEAISTLRLGPFGGNLDHRHVQEGTTLYLPVYHAGALLTVGDGHALQGDAEITGQGLETSMDVEFSVELIRSHFLDQPWLDTRDEIMISGIGRSIHEALQLATAGLSNWLQSYYQLDEAEIATLITNTVRYDIAEIVDPEFHVVARLEKTVLAQLPKPPSPAIVACRTETGCVRH